MTEISALTNIDWDVIVVGTGIGGATLGYALARAGKKVLFCEKGRANQLDNQDALRGDFAEMFFENPVVPQPHHREILQKTGRWFEEIEDASGTREKRFIPFIGSGTGGSSALYGGAMERFYPQDFSPRLYYPEDRESTLPDHWPITYQQLEPYYRQAEKLYRVRGTGDPLRAVQSCDYLQPPSLFPATQKLFDSFRKKGLHPYRLPIAAEYASDCLGCQGFLCKQNCKNDSGRICLGSAVEKFGATLFDQCEVLRLKANRSAITGIVCESQGQTFQLQAKVVVLAAGALATPAILLNSKSNEWPNGVANNTGWVGKNLMRHHIDLYAVFPQTKKGFPGNHKELAFNDLYISGDRKFGTVQSFGALPPASLMVEEVQNDLRHGFIPLLAHLFGVVKPVAKWFFERLFANTIILASIKEDLPYRNNCVGVSQNGEAGKRHLILNYQISDFERDRIREFRIRVKKSLKPYRVMLIKQAENNERIAHACGTCRFGSDPGESVLGQNNRAHELKNLFIVDSSFFPSSAGTNPSLTIAANALRVADHMLGKENLIFTKE